MIGLAQKAFREKMGIDTPVKITWPILESLLPSGDLQYVDYSVAQRLLSDQKEPPESVAALICHLFQIARDGNLCMKVSGNEIIPTPEKISPNLILEGIENLPSYPDLPIVREENFIYLERYWAAKQKFATAFQQILQSKPTIQFEAHTIDQKLVGYSLLPEQLEALKMALTHSLTILTGGPGTGKTFTAGQIVSAFLQLLDSKVRQTCEIVVAAPTGKAAANLNKNLQQVTANLEPFPPIQAKTLHALVNKGKAILSADLILVDESSMIDARMMARLLMVIKPGARLVLLGDPFQLPPVEAGCLFADMLKITKQVVHLNQCLRTELEEIVEFANTVKEGNVPEALERLHRGSAIKRVALENPEALLSYAAPLFASETMDPKELLENITRFRILSPFRKGRFGVDAINRLFFEHFYKKVRSDQWLAVPILVVANDYRLGLFNGELGVLFLKKGDETQNYTIFSSQVTEEAFRHIPAILLPKYEYAYCLSVHKSQGSEYDHMLLVMPEGSEHFGREILYTAVTRARKRLDVCGTDETLSATLSRHSQRLSGIGTA